MDPRSFPSDWIIIYSQIFDQAFIGRLGSNFALMPLFMQGRKFLPLSLLLLSTNVKIFMLHICESSMKVKESTYLEKISELQKRFSTIFKSYVSNSYFL